MSTHNAALGLFEGQAERSYWLPPITIGYIYTLTGDPVHLAISAVSLAGAKYMYDAWRWKNRQDFDDDEFWLTKFLSMVMEEYSGRKKVLTLIYLLAWLYSIFFAVSLLRDNFVHTDPVLVAFAVIYLAVGLLLAHA